MPYVPPWRARYDGAFRHRARHGGTSGGNGGTSPKGATGRDGGTFPRGATAVGTGDTAGGPGTRRQRTAESAQPLLLYLVKQVELAVRARLDEIVRPDGLTALQYTALTVLERHADMSSAQLARYSFVTAQSMADMIAILEARGLIARHRDHVDRRRLVVALTPAGHALLDEYRDTVRALEEGMLAGLSHPEVTALRAALGRCHANLSAMTRPGPGEDGRNV